MKAQNPIELEALLRRELRQLPDLHAPETLFHRVMLAVHQRERLPWWRRSWQSWPAGAQALTLVLLLAMVGAACYAGGRAAEGVSLTLLGSVFAEWLSPFEPVLDLVATLGRAAAMLLRVSGQQLLLGTLLGLFTVYVACIGLGSACARLALQRA
jgi:hypothetical protein